MNHEVRLAAHPLGLPKASDFQLVEVPVRDLDESEVLVRNIYTSLDAGLRSRMRDPVPPYAIGETLGAKP